jgi:3-mercaptopyruvate sulfurtransferase SseA
MLSKAGFEQVSVLRGGMEGRNKAGYAVERNETLESSMTIQPTNPSLSAFNANPSMSRIWSLGLARDFID